MLRHNGLSRPLPGSRRSTARDRFCPTSWVLPRAKLTGSVRANSVVIGGEVEGNIDSAARVELLESGVLNGDLKAGLLTVAAGSRMRGRAEFGWNDEHPVKSSLTLGTSQVS